MATESDVAKTLTAMASLRGMDISEDAAKMMMQDLAEYDPVRTLAALALCRKELGRFPNLADIIARIQATDGRPGAEEAWALAPKSDSDAAYVNNEVMSAWAIADNVLQSGDTLISARMAFKEVYERTVRESRNLGRKPTWWLSRAAGPNRDKANEAAVQDAMNKGRLTQNEAFGLLPDFGATPKIGLQLASGGGKLPDGEAMTTLGEITQKLIGSKE